MKNKFDSLNKRERQNTTKIHGRQNKMNGRQTILKRLLSLICLMTAILALTPTAEAAIRFWQEQDLEGDLSLHEAMKLGLAGEEQQHDGLQVDGIELDDWLQNWLNRLQGDEKLAMLPPPSGFPR